MGSSRATAGSGGFRRRARRVACVFCLGRNPVRSAPALQWQAFAKYVTEKLGGDPGAKKLGQYSRLPGYRNPKLGGRICTVEMLAPSLVRSLGDVPAPMFAGMLAPESRSRSRSPRAVPKSPAPVTPIANRTQIHSPASVDRSKEDLKWCSAWIRAGNLRAIGLANLKDAVLPLAHALTASGAPKCAGRFHEYAVPTARYAIATYRDL